MRSALAFVVLLVAWGPACKGHGRAGSSSVEDAESPAVNGGGEVLARVGDRTITVADFVTAVRHMDEFDRLRYRAPARRKELLGEMIDVMLLADEARAQGYDQDPETQEEIRQILRDAVMKRARDGSPRPSDIPADDVRAYYDAHRADFHEPSRRRVSAIVTSSEASANAVVEALRRDASSWGDLVRSRSIDASAKNDVPADLAGDFGFVGPPGDPRGDNDRIPEPVRAAVFDLQAVGDIGHRPVAADRKFYVVKLASMTEGHDRSLQDAERSIRVKLAQDAAHARETALIEELRRQFPVQVDEKALGEVRVESAGGDAAP
jgi:peptidyl-prolyl cis-trans isomerase C